jgi:pimeloyl-ACP methyl ester carboxylesterase
MACYVLMHGAFHGGWIWQRVAAQLRRAGHEVHTPTLTGCGDRFHLLTRDVGLETHVTDLVQMLVHEDVRDAILVAHSYGGTVATMAAARVPERIQRLIYLDAQAPAHGQTASGALAEGTADRLTELASGADWLLPPLPLDAVGIAEPGDVAWVEGRRHAHPMRTLFEPVQIPPGALAPIAVTYVVCQRHERLIALFGVDPLQPFAERARREGWKMVELDAPHDAMVTAPIRTAEILLADA